MKDYIINEDGSVECKECGCVTDVDTYNGEGAQHWKPCSHLSSDEDMTGPNSDDHDR